MNWRLFAAGAIFCLLTVSALHSQNWSYTRFDLDNWTEAEEASYGIGAIDAAGILDRAILRQNIKRIAEQNVGTPLGAKSRVLLVGEILSTEEETGLLDNLEAIVREYPYSNVEIYARSIQIDRLPKASIAAARSALLTRYGAPTLQEVLATRHTAVLKMFSLPAGLREDLSVVYQDEEVSLSGGNYPSRLVLAQFQRQLGFENVDSPEAIIRNMNDNRPYDERLTQDPKVKLIKPSGRQTGQQPKIVVEISDGDFREPQLDWSELQFRLDGQDLKPMMETRSKFDTKMREGKIFERLRLKYRPSQALAPGGHTIEVVAQTHGYRPQDNGLGLTRFQYTFVVPQPHDNCHNVSDEEGPETDEADFDSDD